MSLVPLFCDVESLLKCPNKTETVDCILFVFPSLFQSARGTPGQRRLSECACHRAVISHEIWASGKMDERGEGWEILNKWLSVLC